MKKVATRITLIVLLVIIGGFAFLKLSPNYNIYLVRSESMTPNLNMGDMVITGPVNGLIGGEVKPGAVVTYQREKGLVTHRVLSINGDTLVTKGDAVEDPDPWSVSMSDIRGVYLFRLPSIGYVSNFIKTKTGWLLLIVAPSAVLFGLLIRSILKEVRKKAQDGAQGVGIVTAEATKSDETTPQPIAPTGGSGKEVAYPAARMDSSEMVAQGLVMLIRDMVKDLRSSPDVVAQQKGTVAPGTAEVDETTKHLVAAIKTAVAELRGGY
ncbi:MAG: signal peptidase I [Dehalococcoidales bacterium]|nr:signal peptidase I [Dehalococcoidales bacterium]